MGSGFHRRTASIQCREAHSLVATALLVILATLLACTGGAPAPDPTEIPAPTGIKATPAPPAHTPTPEATAAPTTRPTAAPAATPTPEPMATPPLDGRLAPILLQDSDSLQSALSDAELSCIGDDPEDLAFALTGPGPEPPEEQARLLGCLHDETLARLFVAGFVPGPETLSLETSECVREAFAVIDPRSVMMAGIERDPGRAMAGSMAAFRVTTACLTDEEWESAAQATGLTSRERKDGQCIMNALGGPGSWQER